MKRKISIRYLFKSLLVAICVIFSACTQNNNDKNYNTKDDVVIQNNNKEIDSKKEANPIDDENIDNEKVTDTNEDREIEQKDNLNTDKKTDLNEEIDIINPEGKTIKERFNVPSGYERITVEEGSFGEYLRNLPLKEQGSQVHYYDGRVKSNDVYEAVIDIDVGDKDLQQCADAVMRLRAEYLYQKGEYNKIHFNFTNEFRCDYSKWMEGNRISIDGNRTNWVKSKSQSNTYQDFREYLEWVYMYAGTLSLSKELQPVNIEDMQIGDVFIEGGSPGHAVTIVDMAINKDTGKKLFMIAQSYMPAQDIQVLKNNRKQEISPWYNAEFKGVLDTPEWVFEQEHLKRFSDN